MTHTPKKYSAAVADLFPDTGGWVPDSGVTLHEGASMLLAGLTKVFGSETRARQVLADIPGCAVIVAALPRRSRGRPPQKSPTQAKRIKDLQVRTIFEIGRARGMTWNEIADTLLKLGLTHAGDREGALLVLKRLKLGKRRAAKNLA